MKWEKLIITKDEEKNCQNKSPPLLMLEKE
jgi:hypothetical protein